MITLIEDFRLIAEFYWPWDTREIYLIFFSLENGSVVFEWRAKRSANLTKPVRGIK